jgi:AcrR family transcriptional regulator
MPDLDDSSDTKERILKIAFDILENEGASALKVRTISERAGLSISVVNHHFGNKQGMLDACKARYYMGLGEVVAAVIAETSGQPLDVLVEAAIRDTFSYSRVHRGVLRMLTSDMFADGEIIEEYQGVGNRPHFNPVMDQFAPGLGLDPKVARVRLQAVSVVLTRFATSSDIELEAIFGLTGDEAVAAAEEHMVQIANLLLCSKL